MVYPGLFSGSAADHPKQHDAHPNFPIRNQIHISQLPMLKCTCDESFTPVLNAGFSRLTSLCHIPRIKLFSAESECHPHMFIIVITMWSGHCDHKWVKSWKLLFYSSELTRLMIIVTSIRLRYAFSYDIQPFMEGTSCGDSIHKKLFSTRINLFHQQLTTQLHFTLNNQPNNQ